MSELALHHRVEELHDQIRELKAEQQESDRVAVGLTGADTLTELDEQIYSILASGNRSVKTAAKDRDAILAKVHPIVERLERQRRAHWVYSCQQEQRAEKAKSALQGAKALVTQYRDELRDACDMNTSNEPTALGMMRERVEKVEQQIDLDLKERTLTVKALTERINELKDRLDAQGGDTQQVKFVSSAEEMSDSITAGMPKVRTHRSKKRRLATPEK